MSRMLRTRQCAEKVLPNSRTRANERFVTIPAQLGIEQAKKKRFQPGDSPSSTIWKTLDFWILEDGATFARTLHEPPPK